MAADQRNSSGSLTAVLLALWAIVLMAAFFWYRGTDVGVLHKLLGSIEFSPFFGSGLIDSLIGLAAAAAIVVSWFGVGHFVYRFIGFPNAESNSHILEAALSIAIGAGIWSTAFHFIGLVGGYYGATAVAAITIGVVLAVLEFLRGRRTTLESLPSQKFAAFDRVLLGLISVPIVLSLIASLAPPTAKDTLLYHFSVPKVFVQQHFSSFVEGNMNSYMALGTEMHIVWAMLAGNLYSQRAGEAAAGAVVWAFFPILLAVVFGWSRELGVERRLAIIGTLMIASVPTIYHVSASAYVDVAWALFVTLAAYALCRWWRTPERTWLVYIAFFLGAALAIKMLTVFALAAFALVIMFRARQTGDSVVERPATLVGAGLVSLIAAVVLASPQYIRTWIETGSPLFPYYLNIWGASAPWWDVERSNLLQAMSAQFGGYEKTFIDLLLTPWNISIAAQPDIATHFDGVIGVAFLLGLPLLIAASWKFDLRVEAKIGAAIACVFFLFWMSSSQQLRYLLPAFPVLAIAVVLSIEAVSKNHAQLRSVAVLSLTAASICGILVTAAWFLKLGPTRVVAGGETRQAYLARNIDYLPYYERISSQTDPSAKVWLINMRRDSYHLERPFVSDYMLEDVTLQRMVAETTDINMLRARTAAMGVNYILARHDFLLNYQLSPLVDPSRPRAENEKKLSLARELLLDPKRTIQADAKFSLVEVGE